VTPGVPFIAASPPCVRLVVVTTENAAALMDGFRAASDMPTSEGAAGCDCIGDKAGNAESKGDCKNSHLTTQHELPFHRGPHPYKQGERPGRAWPGDTERGLDRSSGPLGGEDANLPAADHVRSDGHGPKV
jgi:hypothetical protein